MTWIKLDDNAPRHPKIANLSDKAFRWWIMGLCYASEFLTDGSLPPTFFKLAPAKVRAELTGSRLWIFDDPNLRIHDYLKHQQSRETVEAERRRQRDRRHTERGTTDRRTSGTTPGTYEENTRPPIEVAVDVPEKEIQIKQRSSSLLPSHAYYEQRKQYCAFVGSKIEVPHGLHAELRRTHGGPNPEKELQEWYLALNEQAENEAWRIPRDKEFYPWFKSLYGAKFPATAAHIGTKSVNDEIDEWARS